MLYLDRYGSGSRVAGVSQTRSLHRGKSVVNIFFKLPAGFHLYREGTKTARGGWLPQGARPIAEQAARGALMWPLLTVEASSVMDWRLVRQNLVGSARARLELGRPKGELTWLSVCTSKSAFGLARCGRYSTSL